MTYSCDEKVTYPIEKGWNVYLICWNTELLPNSWGAAEWKFPGCDPRSMYE